MSEDEAINIVKNIVTDRAGDLCCKHCSCGKKARCVRNKKSCLEIASKTILNLYQKEKDRNVDLEMENIGLKEDRRITVKEIQEEYYISKDKIKEFIEENTRTGRGYNEYEEGLIDENDGIIDKLSKMIEEN